MPAGAGRAIPPSAEPDGFSREAPVMAVAKPMAGCGPYLYDMWSDGPPKALPYKPPNDTMRRLLESAHESVQQMCAIGAGYLTEGGSGTDISPGPVICVSVPSYEEMTAVLPQSGSGMDMNHIVVSAQQSSASRAGTPITGSGCPTVTYGKPQQKVTEPSGEIAVTDEMIVRGKAAARQLGVASGQDQLAVVYRAMAAVAPTDPDWEPDHAIISRLRENERQADRLITQLRAERAAWQKLYEDKIAATDEPEAKPQSDVDRVIDQLDRRIIGSPDRQRLRRSLDKAEAPDKSRAGQDAAVGRSLRVGPEQVGIKWKP